MNKICAAIGVAILFVLYTWWVFNLGVNSCEAKVDKTTTTETIRQADDAGDLKAAEAKHEPQIIERIKIVRTAPDPSGCRDMPMPPDVMRALGMRVEIRHGPDQP